MSAELRFMEEAIAQARLCKPEDDRVHPLVGAVLVKDGEVLGKAYRGELADGEHAEYTLLEKKLKEVDVAGATAYVTLEPCTSRNHPKLPCAHRLVDRNIDRVVIGMLDPNPIIAGEGYFHLREAGVEVSFFPRLLMTEVEGINHRFLREQREKGAALPPVTQSYIDDASTRSLDEWYGSINRVYWNRNFRLSFEQVFAHLLEVTGGLSSTASGKAKPDIDAQSFIAKAVAWWLALCGKAGIESVEDLIWDKFPNVCPYCQQDPHDPLICREKKAETRGVMWQDLAAIGNGKKRPASLGEWQVMFGRLYPVQQTETYGPSFARLMEEVGELAEAIRVFSAEPGYFLSEAADVFAWLMHVQNILESVNEVRSSDRGIALQRQFATAYPDGCRDCGSRLCRCPPILPSTIGRIAHEVPTGRGGVGAGGRFLTSEQASRKFRPSSLRPFAEQKDAE